MFPPYHGNFKWLPEATIFITRHGSRAYGTNTPTSDEDLKGIFVAPPAYYFGFNERVEVVDKGFDADVAMFELRKFFALAAQCNPNIIELLYTDPSDHLLVTPAAQKLLDNRSLFLSRQALHTFSGYAYAQLKRIEGHNRWGKMAASGNEPRMPTRAEFDLPERPTFPHDQREAAESMVRKQVEAWSVKTDLDDATRIALDAEMERILLEMKLATDDDVWRAAGRHVGLDDNFMEVVMRERRYRSKVREYEQYTEWRTNRNENRAELEARFGYDTKHGMHLVRLMRMAKEILRDGSVLVRRPDAEELLAIRNGAWTYDELIEYATKTQTELDALAKVSPLPSKPDRNAMDLLCQEIARDIARERRLAV